MKITGYKVFLEDKDKIFCDSLLIKMALSKMPNLYRGIFGKVHLFQLSNNNLVSYACYISHLKLNTVI